MFPEIMISIVTPHKNKINHFNGLCDIEIIPFFLIIINIVIIKATMAYIAVVPVAEIAITK